MVARNAQRWDTKLSQRTGNAPPTELRVACEISDEEKQIISAAVEERDVVLVPKEMNITDHPNRGCLRGAFVHGTKVSRPSAACEREGNLR